MRSVFKAGLHSESVSVVRVENIEVNDVIVGGVSCDVFTFAFRGEGDRLRFGLIQNDNLDDAGFFEFSRSDEGKSSVLPVNHAGFVCLRVEPPVGVFQEIGILSEDSLKYKSTFPHFNRKTEFF